MKHNQDTRTKVRLLSVMRALVERPFGYTVKELAGRYDVNPDTIRRDFDAFKAAGFTIEIDNKYRYAFLEDKPYLSLKKLLHFSEEDQFLLEEAIDQISPHTERGKRLKKKLGSLYDYGRLGHSYLRKPYLNKVDILLQAQKEKRKVILQGYHSSNSNIISDRVVEPFHTNPPDDMVHTYDLLRDDLRHFRISRFRRIKILDEPWENETKHIVKPTDPFRIVDSNQVPVHLRMKVGAYNDMIERFPQTKGHIEETEEEEVFDFFCMINHKFLGLTNFILGNYHQGVEVLEPESLIDHLNKEISSMKF